MSPFKHTPEQARAAWVAALTSGDYQQTHCALCRLDGGGQPVGYCCLGVACEIFQQLEGGLEIINEVGSRLYDGKGAYLPDKVTAWLGLRDIVASGFIDPKHDHLRRTLPSLNDGERYDFATIAAVIESAPAHTFLPPAEPAA